ncbi:MAG TPA: trimethylamine methyltransferase family protein [Anaerolineae bacterium]|nr:trimethylamine methyltransferase family protein [Anaerolineae bacterium]
METSRADRRAARRRQRAESPLLKIPFRQLRNPLPPLEILAPEQIEEIHQASLHILETVGLDFLDNEALELWQKAGAKVDRANQHVWIDRGLLLETIASAPPSFTWRARNPERDVLIGANSIAFGPNGGMVYAAGHHISRRPGTMQDYENFVKLSQMCNVLHFAAWDQVTAHDVPVSLRHLERLYAAFALTDKAVMEAAHGREITTDCLNMARIVFGDLSGDPVIGDVINVNSPLRYDNRMLGGLITYARAGQVTFITPFILAGAMSPITIASALAQQNAEALAGIALTQLVRPGAPVIYGGFTTNVDMKSGSPAFGTPEGAWALAIGAQLARRYNLPYRASGSLTTAKVPDAQAAYETLWTLWPAILSHSNLIMHAVGWLEGGLTASFEKFIIDAENLAMFYHFLDGFQVNDETLALDMIAEVGPGGHHFGTSHTQARYSTEFYASVLSDRQPFDTWREAGGLDAAQRAHLVWQEMLAQYEPPPLDPAIAEALREYIERRERELQGKNLYDS